VEKRLDSKYGIALLRPLYRSYHLNLGEVSSYPPGYKENGSIFCHNNPWISCAEAVLGHGEPGVRGLPQNLPGLPRGSISEIHRTEPYVYSQMVAGPEAPRFGEAKNSWLTGTAAWTFTDVSQYHPRHPAELRGAVRRSLHPGRHLQERSYRFAW
jgi:cellobiose phosphorylase